MLNKSSLTVSAIIPTYNRKNWLEKSINSIIIQTCQPIEIIVVDDGSNDATKSFVQQKYPTVKYIRQPNQGPGSARNIGAMHANGKWLAFLDSDDEWMPEKLNRQIEFIQKNEYIKAVYTNEIWYRKGRRVNQKKKHSKFGGHIYQHCLPLCIISPSSILIEKKLFEQLGQFDVTFPACEDYELWLRLAAQHEIGFLDEPLIIKNGGHDDQLSRQWGLDLYRVRALDKILNSGILNTAQFQQTIENLAEKCKIILVGYNKRGRKTELDYIERLKRKWDLKL